MCNTFISLSLSCLLFPILCVLSFKHSHRLNLIKNFQLSSVLFLKPIKNLPLKMAKLASKCLFLFFLFLLTLSSSGTQVGFSYNARGSISASSVSRTLSVLELNKVTESQIRVFVADHKVLSTLSKFNVSVDFYLNESLVENFTNSKSSAIFWLKTRLFTFLPHVNIESIIVRGSNDLSKLLSSLKSIHSVLNSFKFDNEMKVSVAFSLSFLENLDREQENDLHRVLGFIKRSRSFIIVQDTSENGVELSKGDLFLKSMIQKVKLATSALPCKDVAIVMTVKSLVDPSSKEVAEFAAKLTKSLENTKISGQMVELYAEVCSMESFVEKELKREHEQIFPYFRRELLKITSHDSINPPVTNPTPTIVTVPATNPVTITPTNPTDNPVTIPSTTPVMVPPTNPSINPPAPITNPVTTPTPGTVPGGQPITNPVTTYPAPPGNVPVTTPIPNPVSPPATTNAPAIPGQSWCVAKSGVSETALQSALDYACGMGGADCSQIQQGGSCYNPNTLQNHASYAFNSYYQKNPAAASCDFAGTATIVSTNPSTASCIFPLLSSSSSTSSLPTPSTSTTNPATTPLSPGDGTSSGTVTPPSVLNSSSPGSGGTTVFGSDAPPGVSTSTSKSATLQPSIGCIFLITYLVAKRVLNM